MIVRTAADFGTLLRNGRKTAGLSQVELARRLGTTQRWVSEVERAKPTAELGRVLQALEMVGVRLDAREAGAAEATAPAMPQGYPTPEDVLRRVREKAR